jgi:hypothetical protein
VVLVGNLAQLTGGVAELQLPATSVKQLFQQLGELHPALAPHLDEGVAVAIDGQIYQDALFQPIGPHSEVYLLPQIAGGSEAGLASDHTGDGRVREAPMEQTVGLHRPGVMTRTFFKIGERMFGQVPTPERLMAQRMPLMLGLGGLYGAIEWLGTIDAQLRALLNVQVATLHGVPY